MGSIFGRKQKEKDAPVQAGAVEQAQAALDAARAERARLTALVAELDQQAADAASDQARFEAADREHRRTLRLLTEATNAEQAAAAALEEAKRAEKRRVADEAGKRADEAFAKMRDSAVAFADKARELTKLQAQLKADQATFEAQRDEAIKAAVEAGTAKPEQKLGDVATISSAIMLAHSSLEGQAALFVSLREDAAPSHLAAAQIVHEKIHGVRLKSDDGADAEQQLKNVLSGLYFGRGLTPRERSSLFGMPFLGKRSSDLPVVQSIGGGSKQ